MEGRKQEQKEEAVKQQLIEQQALHDLMMNFTVQDAFNKAKAGIKLPVLQQSFKHQGLAVRKLHHLEYYKHQKEIYHNRQAQLQMEQSHVQHMLTKQILATMNGDLSLI